MSTTTNLGITKLDAGLRQPEVVINNALDTLDAAFGTTTWASWTPTWTNLSVGNGTVVAKYSKNNKTVFCRLSIVFGSTTSISGSVSFTLPVTRAANAGTQGLTWQGGCRAFDSSPGVIYEGIIVNATTTTGLISFLDSSGTYVTRALTSSTVPFTWATSDEIAAEFFYEAA